jgi:hypothetical protein
LIFQKKYDIIYIQGKESTSLLKIKIIFELKGKGANYGKDY